MKVEIKIYKTFDPELYALSAYGIKVTSLMKKALEAYVRGEYVHFHIPQSITYDFDMKKRCIHLAMTIDDPQSVNFLRKNIKSRHRTAFLKSLVRGSFTTPQLGVFFNSENLNKEDTKMIKLSEVEHLDNLIHLPIQQQPRRDYTILKKDEKGQPTQTSSKRAGNTENTNNHSFDTSDKPKKKKKRKKNKQHNHLDPYPSTEKQPTQSNTTNPVETTTEQTQPTAVKLENKFGIVADLAPASLREKALEQEKPIAPLIIEEEDDDDDDDIMMFNAFGSLRS